MPRPDSPYRTPFARRLSGWSLLLLTALIAVSSVAQGATWYDHEFAASYWEACLNSQQNINSGSTPAAGLGTTGSSAYIVSDLVPIDLANPHAQVPVQNISGVDHVLTTTYTDYTGYYRDGVNNEVVIGQNLSVWVTPGTTLYDQVVTTEGTAAEDMAQRTSEILGLPTSTNADRIVEVWVKPGDMFRPARDPNMTTTVSPTEFTSAGEAYPHLPDAFKYDASGNLLTADQAYQNYTNWLDATVANSYTINADGTTATSQPYPYTAMGYTYDTANEDGSTTSGTEIEGLSEYIIQGKAWDPATVPAGQENTEVVVQGVFSTSSYATIVRNADGIRIDGFNVTGTVDTIWAGEKYYEIGDAQLITVQADGKITEGIEVASTGYTINNYGKITGPGKNFDPADYSGATHRESTILLSEGGTINNYGTISGTVSIDSTGATNATTITNRGLIIGNVNLSNTVANTFTANSGVILGDVDLGGNAGSTFQFTPATGTTSAMAGDIDGVATVTVGGEGQTSYCGTIENDLAVMRKANLEVLRTSSLSMLEGASLMDSSVIAVGGNLTLAAATVSETGATYTANLYKPAEYSMLSSQIKVTGTATLGIGSLVNIDINQDSSVPIRGGEQFVVMTAAGGVTDSGATYTTDSAFLSFDHWVEDSTQLVVQLRQPTSFESVASGESQKATAAALDADHEVGSSSFAVMTNSLLFSNSTEFQQSMNTLSPMPYFAIERASRRITQDMAAGLSDYLRNRRNYLRRYYGTSSYRLSQTNSKVSTAERQASLNQVADDEYIFGDEATMVDYEFDNANSEYSVIRPQNCGLGYGSLVRPFGTFFSQAASADRTGFESNGSGLQITIDRAHSSQFLFGWEIDYASNSIKFKNSLGDATLDLFRVGPYLSWFDGCKFLDLSVSYGYNANKIRRNASYTDHTAYAQRKFDAHDVSVYLGGGRDYDWYGYTFTPEASLQYIYYGRDRFTEQEAAGSALEIASYSGNSLRMMVGSRLSKSFLSGNGRIFIPELNAGWAHEFLGDDSMEARFAGGVTPFTITPGGLYRDSAYYGAAVTFLPTENMTLAGRYRGEITDDGPFHACELSLTLGY